MRVVTYILLALLLLLQYPLWLGKGSWLKVWDVFLEHSHRLIGATTGIITIALAGALWLLDERRWMRWLGIIALAGVILQGVLGGLRVVLLKDQIGILHALLAQLFLVVMASIAWRTMPRRGVLPAPLLPATDPGRARMLAAIATCGDDGPPYRHSVANEPTPSTAGTQHAEHVARTN